MMFLFHCHWPALAATFREARLCARNGAGFGHPGESFRGFQAPRPSVPNMQLRNAPQGRTWFSSPRAAPTRFRWFSGPRENTAFGRGLGGMRAEQLLPHWQYHFNVERIVHEPTSAHLHELSQDAIIAMHDFEDHRIRGPHGPIKRFDRVLREVGDQIPADWFTPDTFLGLASAAGLGPRVAVPAPLDIEAAWSGPRLEAMMAIRNRLAQTGNPGAALLDGPIAAWPAMPPHEQGDILSQAIHGAKRGIDTYDIYEQYLNSIGTVSPRQYLPRL